MDHIHSIIIAFVFVAVIAVLFFAAKGKYRKVAKHILLSLVLAAEKRFGGGTGEIKFAVVADALYERLPFIVQILFTENDIAKMIEEAVDRMKEILKDNPQASMAITGKEAS
jgi:hypothetical protein